MGIVLTLVVYFVYSLYQDKKRVMEEKTSSHRELLTNAFELSVLDTEKGLNQFATKMISDHRIVDAFEAGDRDSLYAFSLPYFNDAHQHNEVDLTGFIRADGVHFLRLTDPKKFGDNITKKRPMIAQAIQTRRPLTSLDVTLYNISLVSILPIYKADHFLGVVQVSVNIDRIQNRLNAHSGIKSALAFDTQTLHAILPSSDNLKKYTNYSIISSNDPLFENLPNDYAFDYSVRHTMGKKTYIIVSRELTTYANKPLARMVCALDITQDEIIYRQEIIQLILISTLMLIILGVILHLGFKTLIHRINRTSAELNKQLRQQIYTDSLTKLSNRKALIETLRHQDHFGILLINIDNFKELNDLYGHDVGDKLLQTIAESIKKTALIHRLTPYKMPSDEYALLLRENLSTEVFDQMCTTILHSLNESYYEIDGITIFANVTIGADFCLDPQCDLIERADMSLKTAKKQALTFLKYNDSLLIKEEYRNNVLWSKKLKDAIDANRFTLFYQGIHDAYTDNIYEYEALIRIIDTDGSVISPAFFLDIAKKTRLYSHITKFVIQAIFHQLRTTPHSYSINLSVSDILNNEITAILYTLLAESNAGNRLIFEILESEGIENHIEVSAFITHVKAFGCRIAIDDFGTGYSNFAHILRFNVDFIKIDASLIKQLNVDLSAQDIVRTIVEFAHRLNIKTIAEFVHSQDVYDECKELGVDYFQGYYLSEPKPL
jgi:diguanylate cyclase (GGDEF)-like protein